MYPHDTSKAFKYQGWDRKFWSLAYDEQGDIQLEEWTHPTEPQPTPADVQAILDSPEYQAWAAEHGGDETLTKRRRLREVLESDTGRVLVIGFAEALGKTPAQVRQRLIARILDGDAD